jgi:hypothetical protein
VLLEVGARVSNLFTTVLARYRDMLVFRHAARITESCLAEKLRSEIRSRKSFAHATEERCEREAAYAQGFHLRQGYDVTRRRAREIKGRIMDEILSVSLKAMVA